MSFKIKNVRYGEVVSVNDPDGMGLITVRIAPLDDTKVGNPDKWKVRAFPLLPKQLFVQPKVGEGVLVLMTTLNDDESNRFYIGPVISQMHRMFFDPWFGGGDTYQPGGPKTPDANQDRENAEGAFPGPDDVAINGRKNCDIIVKDDDIRIRAGVKLSSDQSKYKIVFNKKNPAYMKLKYHETPLNGDTNSTATIVSDKIFLLSSKSNAGVTIDNTDPKDLITDEQLNKLLEDAYKLPYGEKLVKLLKDMARIFKEHTHDTSCAPPNSLFITRMDSLIDEPLNKEKLLSNNIRIN